MGGMGVNILCLFFGIFQYFLSKIKKSFYFEKIKSTFLSVPLEGHNKPMTSSGSIQHDTNFQNSEKYRRV